MIIIRTPYRVSLFGGGTDHPSWYRENSGSVLSFSIDKFSYVNIRELPPFFKHRYRISYSKIEVVEKVNEIKHPVVREAFRKFSGGQSLELHHHGDLPARSGVGSSSAFSVGVIHALLALQGAEQGEIEKQKLADLAINFEQIDLAEAVGSQDQVACALGGINFINFGPGERWVHESLQLSPDYLKEIETRMVLVFSGVDRISSNIQKSLLENIETKFEMLKRTQELAKECYEIFRHEGSLEAIGTMLNESWELKLKMNPLAATELLQNLFNKARLAGADGGKILGAGGGGFCLFWIDPKIRESFIKEMHPYLIVPIKISFGGSTRIY